MNPVTKVLAILSLVLLSAAAHADVQSDLNACGDAPDATNMSMTSCAAGVADAQDAVLKTVYAKALVEAASYDSAGAAGTTNAQDALKKSESAFLAYRSAECNAELGLYDGGSGGPLAYASCSAIATAARATELTNVYLQPN